MATKTWMYFTWFFYCIQYIDNILLHAVFFLNTALLTYHFYKAVMMDPGFIKPSREQQLKVIFCETYSVVVSIQSSMHVPYYVLKMK